MKKNILFLAFVLISSIGFSQKYASYGEKITSKGAKQVDELLISENGSIPKVYGEVESVCEVKGCWMKLKMADGSTMRVTFKDYGFFVPKDIAGKKVIIEGESRVRETSVADLKHFAKDAGKSETEINKIVEPKTELTFIANGVLIQR